MGCSSSNTALVPLKSPDEQPPHRYYTGFGFDYTNYGYYSSMVRRTNSTGKIDPVAWGDYCKDKDTRMTAEDDGDQSIEQQKISKQSFKSESEFSLKIREDSALTNEKIQPDADPLDKSSDGKEIVLRYGFKTLSTALRITVTKKSQFNKNTHGLKTLNVRGLDTIRAPDIEFVKKKPSIEKVKFIDSEFNKNDALGKYASLFDWKRPEVIYPNCEICLFHEGASLDDIKQGEFATCYFLATLAGLASHSEALRQVVLPNAYDPDEGIFHCRFWKYGHWCDVYIDDNLPCNKNGLVGCKSSNYDGELWIPLLEKAYAKFIGSYPDVEGGTPREAFLALTGGYAEWLPLTYYDYDSSSTYSRLHNALQAGSVIVCNTSPKTEKASREIEEKGIVLNHAYTVVATAVVEREGGVAETLIELRNPWSHKEWTGPWGDRSMEWYSIDEKMRNQLREVKDDGSFWMPWSEYWDVFTDLYICSFTPDFDYDGISDGLDCVYCIYGEWQLGRSAGSENPQLCYPKFEFSISETATKPIYFVAECLQILSRKTRKATPTNILLQDVTAGSDVYANSGAETSIYTTANPVVRRFQLEPGHSYRIIPMKMMANDTGQFLLRTFTKVPLEFELLEFD